MPRPRAFEHIFVLVFCRFSKNLKLLALMIFDLWYSKEGKTWFKKGAFVTLNFFVQNITRCLRKVEKALFNGFLFVFLHYLTLSLYYLSSKIKIPFQSDHNDLGIQLLDKLLVKT